MLNNTKLYQRSIAASFILLAVGAAYGQEQGERPPNIPPVSQVIYKGVVGNLLDEMPIDTAKRVDLQRTSAVVSNALSGRSLAVMLGVASPILMVAGLLWGVFAASQINAAPTPATLPGPQPERAGPEPLASAAFTSIDVAPIARAEDSLFCAAPDPAADILPAVTASADKSLMSSETVGQMGLGQ